jgi:hypothetical protein
MSYSVKTINSLLRLFFSKQLKPRKNQKQRMSLLLSALPKINNVTIRIHLKFDLILERPEPDNFYLGTMQLFSKLRVQKAKRNSEKRLHSKKTRFSSKSQIPSVF